MSIAGESGAQSHKVSCAVSVEALPISNSVGDCCQKFFIASAMPPDVSPMNAQPRERVPPMLRIQLLLSLVRFSTVHESGEICVSLYASHTAMSDTRFAFGISSRLGRGLPAI